MEVMLKWSEKRAENIDGEDDDGGSIEKFENEGNMLDGHQPINYFSPKRKDSIFRKQDDQLESTRAEMGEVKQENERLKTILGGIMKDYQSLKTQIFCRVQQGHDKKSPESTGIHQETEESELVSLSLGTSSWRHKKEKTGTSTDEEDEQISERLSLGLDCRFDGSSGRPTEADQSNSGHEKSFDEQNGEEARELPQPPSNVLKTSRAGDGELSQQTHVKKARVSVRARCHGPTMNDGCHWRKYGQKISKGNPCPRAYYRCTVASGCPVRKQVQRCADDMSILITTYEGTHNHPLPLSATAMASTTSAAACMLMSGSSASGAETEAWAMATSTIATASLQGLKLGHDSSQRRFCLPDPALSSSPSHATVTLDLTSPLSSSFPSTQTRRVPSNFPSTTSLSFSPSVANPDSTCWSSGHLSYGTQAYKNGNHLISSFGLGKEPQEPFYPPYSLQKNTSSTAVVHAQNPLTDTIAAATKAIAADPSFQSALTAAITSVVGGQGRQATVDSLLQRLRWGEQFSQASPFMSPQGRNVRDSRHLTRSNYSNTNPRQGDHN